MISPSNVHSLKMTSSRSLHDDPNNSKGCCTNEGIPSPISIGNRRSQQGSEETPCLKSGDDVGREIGLSSLA